MASTGSMKSSLSHLLSLELGPLKELIRRALNRVRLGISDREALMMMASETASHRVYVANKILIDALSYGGDPLEVSKILGNHVIRFLEFRKRRLAVARSFEGIIFVMQPATVALLDILLFLCGYFSGTMTALPFFSFGEIPMSFIRLANLVIVIYLSVLNALAIQEISSGFWGAFLWKLGLLLIVSGVIWLGVDLLIGGVFSKMMPGLETLIPG
jgi:archaellum biogenesis protein FlaJ (TadC family)